jgi:NADH-quinone oxidoreductase subunit L
MIPMLGFVGLSLFGDKLPRQLAGYVASAAIGLAFLVTCNALTDLLALDPAKRLGNVDILYPWIVSGKFKLNLAILIDPLSVFMLMVVTGVGFVIHVYSIGYMEGDPEYARFFSYMNLFIFSMSVLVLAADFFFLIVGWALVGLASYLLIGFWSEKTSAVLAARKAFVMNVIGDVGMVVAAFIIFQTFGTLDYLAVFDQAPKMFLANNDVMLLVTFFLLVGAFAKSAQIPLHTWLPDAMEGPTPVSALIHAATMVTAGVYLIARCHVLYELAPYVMYLIAGVGLGTAIFAGTIGMVQYDIKRVIAYSTMSQLGYMFLAVGLGVFSLGMFHLMTHAFFKALLFLSAGSVIHGLHGEQDIRKMGGLRHSMPITHITFLIGALALAGFPLTSGYYSKEAIILSAFHGEKGNIIFWLLAVLGAGLTGIYTFRVFFYTFMGKSRNAVAHPHESPPVMAVPLMVLAFFALVSGFFGPGVFKFLAPVFGGQVPAHHADDLLEGVALIVGLGGVIVAGVLYMTSKEKLDFAKMVLAPVYDVLFRKYYIDEIYDYLIVQPVRSIGEFLENTAEKEGIDYSVDKVGEAVRETSGLIGLWQSGKVRTYALNMLVGLALILMFVVFK